MQVQGLCPSGCQSGRRGLATFSAGFLGPFKLPTDWRGHVLPAERSVTPENNIDFFCELRETTSQRALLY